MSANEPKRFPEKFTYDVRPRVDGDIVKTPLQPEELQTLKGYIDRISDADTFKQIVASVAGRSKELFVPQTTPLLLQNGMPLLSVPVICVTACNKEMDTTLTAGQYLELNLSGVWVPVRVEHVLTSLHDSSSHFMARVVGAGAVVVLFNPFTEQMVLQLVREKDIAQFPHHVHPRGLVHTDTVKVRPSFNNMQS